MIGILVAVALIAGPLAALAFWLWRRSRREPVRLVEPFHIGRTLGRGLSVLSAPWILPMAVLALAVVGLPQAIQQYYLAKLSAVSATPFQKVGQVWTTIGITSVLGLLFHIPALQLVVARIEGRPFAIGEAMASLPRLLLPVLGFGILLMIGVTLGTVLLIVPGIILFLRWSAGFAVLVVERTSVGAAFGRSAELAIGSRGRILLVYLLIGVAGAVLGTPERWLMPVSPWAGMLLSGAVATIVALVSAGIGGAVYCELRQIREGGSLSGLADIFS